MPSDANKDVVVRYISEFWNEKNPAVLVELLDPTYREYTYEPRNQEGQKLALALMNAAFADHETIIEEIVGEDDIVAVCQTLRATHSGPFRGLPASGKRIEIGGYRFFEVRDGKITSHRGLLDLPALLQQIDVNR